ncbi:MAG: PDZ domain-containing protein [Gemmatimonadota bacterium]|nr:PDZ domain-containing protein [Gemmatimonadota bacterium]
MKRRFFGALAVAGAGLATLVASAGSAAAQERGERSIVVSPQARALSVIRGSGSFLGVTILEVDDERAAEVGLAEEHGVYVAAVSEDGPAGDAGVEEGDVIVGWNDERVESVAQLQRLLRETPPGRTVRLGVMRDGAERTLAVELGERGAAPIVSMPRGQRFEVRPSTPMPRLERPRGAIRSVAFARRPRLGASIQSLGDQLAAYFGVEGGALVTSVSEDSPASRAGLRAGDVIVGLDGESVDEPGDLLDVLGGLEPGTVSMRIVREGAERTLRVEIEEPAEGGLRGDDGEPFGLWLHGDEGIHLEPFTMEGFEIGPVRIEGWQMEPFEWHHELEEGGNIEVHIPSFRVPDFELPPLEVPGVEGPGVDVSVLRTAVDV